MCPGSRWVFSERRVNSIASNSYSKLSSSHIYVKIIPPVLPLWDSVSFSPAYRSFAPPCPGFKLGLEAFDTHCFSVRLYLDEIFCNQKCTSSQVQITNSITHALVKHGDKYQSHVLPNKFRYSRNIQVPLDNTTKKTNCTVSILTMSVDSLSGKNSQRLPQFCLELLADCNWNHISLTQAI